MGRTKTKTFTQPDTYSCGPAALKIALRVLGIHKSYEYLADLCKTTKNGTSVTNLIKAANQVGLSLMSLESVDYLYMDVKPHEDTGHYATIARYSARNSRLILFDSYSGSKKSYLWTDFLDRWYDYDFKRVKATHSIRRYRLYKRWHNRLLLVLATNPKFLPKFTNSSAKIYLPNSGE
jgi:ABC-type bacteriocin/lantibiotic exporter with double-glycine peptidase domain